MHILEFKINNFLKEIAKGQYKVPEELLNKFGKETQRALKKQFEREPKDFKLYISNIGKPSCILEFEQAGVQGDYQSNLLRNVLGDLVEDLVIFILEAIPDITIVSELQRTSIKITEEVTLNGEYDLILDLHDGKGPGVWDVKSASDWTFKNKFNSFEEFYKDDTFGYTFQLLGYAKGTRVPPRGWCIVNKSSGEIRVLEFPGDDSRLQELERDYDRQCNNTIRILSESKQAPNVIPSKRCFQPEPETFRKRETGNLVLNRKCELCAFKFKCWPTLELKPQAKSEAKNKKLIWYTEFKEE